VATVRANSMIISHIGSILKAALLAFLRVKQLQACVNAEQSQLI